MSNLQYFYSKSDITPEESVALAGYANRSGTSQEVHRPLSSRCMVLKKDHTAVCLIVNDLMEVPPEIVYDIRRQIADKTGMDYRRIIMTSIHTHSAPLMEYGVDETTDRYIQFAANRIIDNGIRTILHDNLYTAGSIRIGYGTCDIGAQRKLIKPESGPPHRISDPQGIRDKDVAVLQIVDDKGLHPVIIFHYACHPVTLGFKSLWVSPDFPGKAREIVEASFGGDALFLNGAAANINPLTEQHTDPRKPDEYGEKLGRAVIETALRRVETELDLHCLTRTMKIPYRDRNITPDFIEKEVMRKSRQKTEFYHWEQDVRNWGNKIKTRLAQGMIQNHLPLENSVVKLGPVLFSFSQGELFVEYQIALKKRYSDYAFFCVGYAHGEGAYIPTAKAYIQGGYETDQAYIYQGLPSPFTKEIEKIYLTESTSLVDNILHQSKN